jgi:hypothetical protein
MIIVLIILMPPPVDPELTLRSTLVRRRNGSASSLPLSGNPGGDGGSGVLAIK